MINHLGNGANILHQKNYLPKNSLKFTQIEILKTNTPEITKNPLHFRNSHTGTQSKPELKKKFNFWNAILLISPITSLLGGSSLIVSSLLPSIPKPSTIQTSKQTSNTIETTSVSNPESEMNVPSDVQQFFKKMGWTFSTIGLFSGCVSGISLGKVSKQPSMVVSSVASLITVPLLLIDPSVTIRTAMWFFTAQWLCGFANKAKNEYELKPGEKPREMDMSALFSIEELKKKSGKTAWNDLSVAWGHEAWQTLKFTAVDQVLIVKDTYQSTKNLFKNKKNSPSITLPLTPEQVQALPPGTNKEIKAPEKPLSKIRPTSIQNHLGAMLLYLGSTPILFLGGSHPQVIEICTKLIAGGILSANSSLFSTALRDKNKTLLVGLPLSVLGNAWMHTDMGMGVSQLGSSAIQEYFRQEVEKKSPPPSEKAS
ncbi:MAG: hypothetical protein K2X66_10255 [Cyanobacteria bacterium]|nr:hypothetical protein [Cyanobacteriota bacterium]